MKKLTVFFLIICGVFGLYAQVKTVSVVCNPWPPFADPESPTEGLAIEIIRAAYKTQGYNVDMKYFPWARCINGVKEGKYDILAATWMTKDRKEFLAYSDSYTTNRIVFIKKEGTDFTYSKLQDLRNLNVGVIREYGYGQDFLNANYINHQPANNFVTNIKKLVAGRIDLTLEDEIVARIEIAKQNPKWLSDLEFLPTPLSENKLYISSGLANPNHKVIIATFNKGLQAIKENGEYANILKKYGL